jgi:hypothetical protein
MRQDDINNRLLKEIVKAIKHISYGEVVITIHNSRVVQIEKKEKRRFTQGEPLYQQS